VCAAGIAAALAILLAAPAARAAAAEPEEREGARAEGEKREGKARRRHVPADRDLLEIVSPAAGDRFVAGETVTIAWREGASFGREAARIHEWEAFLSLDGGGHYPYRLTPHLDRERRSFAIRLPDHPSPAARFLIRLGDEVRELEFELPWTFEISAANRTVAVPRILAVAKGEAARGGEQGVMSWLEGDHQGRRLRTIEAPPRDASWQSVDAAAMLELETVAPASRIPSIPLSALFSHPETGARPRPRPRLPESAPPSFEPRLQTCRINE
jgi:hypothetical protein